MSYLYLQPLPPTAPSTALQHQCATHSHSPTSQIHSTATVSSCRLAGTAGEKLWCYVMVSMRKHGARHGNAIYLRMPESTRTAPTALEKCTCPSCRTKATKYAPFPRLPFSRTLNFSSTQPSPLPPLNNPTPEQAFLAKNYDENARRADRDPRGIFRTPTDASAAPAAGLVGPLGASSFSLPTVERALAEMEGGLGRRAGAGAPTSTSPVLGSAPSPTQHEVLQNFFKSLLNPKDRAASPSTSAVSPGAGAIATATASGKTQATGPRTSSGSGDSQTDLDADAGSGTEDG